MQETYRTVSKFDRIMGSLQGLPDVNWTKPTTTTGVTVLIGEVQTFIVLTARQIERDGDASKTHNWIFVQYMDSGEAIQLAIPPAAAEAIYRQRDALTTKIRKRIGKESAAARKARGESFGFQKGNRKRKGAK